MSFNSLDYIVFLPIVFVLFYFARDSWRWAVLLAAFGGVGLILFVVLPANLILQKLAAMAVLLMLAWTFPRTWLKGKLRSRQKVILKGLPDAMDLVTTCVEAGLGLDAALARVAERTEGPFADELQVMMRDVALGKLRRAVTPVRANCSMCCLCVSRKRGEMRISRRCPRTSATRRPNICSARSVPPSIWSPRS